MLTDSHCHLADAAFRDDLEAVAARASEAGVRGALCILAADDEEELVRAAAVREAWPGVAFATAVHPHRAGAHAGRVPGMAGLVRAAAARVQAVALGEMGLDYHYDFAPSAVQQEVFAAQVDLAVVLDLPVAIHTREAGDDTIAILREAGQGRVRGVMHCFTGTEEEARRALALGFYLSIPGIVTFPKAEALRAVARLIPEDRLLVETDAPYLAPVPHRGRRNEPAFLAETARALAAIRGVAPEVLAARLQANVEALFGRRRVDTPAKPVV